MVPIPHHPLSLALDFFGPIERMCRILSEHDKSWLDAIVSARSLWEEHGPLACHTVRSDGPVDSMYQTSFATYPDRRVSVSHRVFQSEGHDVVEALLPVEDVNIKCDDAKESYPLDASVFSVLPKLRRINLSALDVDPASLAALGGTLEELEVAGSFPSLEVLDSLPALTSFALRICDDLQDVAGLEKCSAHLQRLTLVSCWNLTSIDEISQLTALVDLKLGYCRITNVGPLSERWISRVVQTLRMFHRCGILFTWKSLTCQSASWWKHWRSSRPLCG